MDLLILGGTVFLGRALVDAALARGHQVSLFNRGKSNPDLFPQVEHLRGNRDGGLEVLNHRRWDAVIDTSGYIPRVVRQSARLLSPAVQHYTFISSLSVYGDVSQPGADENTPVGELDDPATEQISAETYGPLKVLCERAVEAEMPGRALIIRPGLIVGPYDPTDRFTYWVARVAKGGDVLAPGRPERFIQFIDVRDLAEWTLLALERGLTGIYNADRPAGTLDMGGLLQACERISAGGARLVWVDEGFLLEQGVAPWTELPLWIPESDPGSGGFFAFSTAKAQADGLSTRPLEDTVRATLEWCAQRPRDHAWRAGLKPAREQELLDRWRVGG